MIELRILGGYFLGWSELYDIININLSIELFIALLRFFLVKSRKNTDKDIFRKQEALQYHIDEHRRKTAETEKEQKKKDKKENQENSKGDKSDNEINAALGLAALGQLSDQKDGGTGPPSLTKGSKGE